MSERGVARALARLAGPGCVLAREPRSAAFGVFPGADRRRRPVARVSADAVRDLEADGVIDRRGDEMFILSEAGAARVRREGAYPSERFIAQHRAVGERTVMDDAGDQHVVRGHDPDAALRRLAGLRDSAGAPWLSTIELGAASRLRADWDEAERGLVRGSDWASPPMGSAPRGGNGADVAMAARCDARRRMTDALDALAPALRRIAERVCLHEQGLETMERGEGWPARSGKVALKLALSQLAATY